MNTILTRQYSWLSTHPFVVAVGVYCLFIITVLIIGVLIVYLATKTTSRSCRVNFKRTLPKPIQYNYGPRSVAIGDFNNDSYLDFVIANHIVSNMAIYLGTSKGSFFNPFNYSTGSNSNPYMVVVARLNNDEQLDIAVANFGTNNVGIFLGLGNGSFKNNTTISTGVSRPIAICFADYNQDQRLDLVTANYGTESVSIYYGNGFGDFPSSMTY